MPLDMKAWQSTPTRLEDNEPPPPGMYDVRIEACDMFDSQAGETWMTTTYVIVKPDQHAGHMWKGWSGFRENQLQFTKNHMKALGIDVNVASQDDLEAQLNALVGRHFTVEVVKSRNGYLNTNVKAPASAPLPPTDIPIPGVSPNGHDKDDESYPF